eukprot:14357766-Ditylum_brightwellii.AAC.1
MCAVAEDEATAQAIVKEKSWENQEAKYNFSSSDHPVGSSDGQCCVPYLPDSYSGPTFVTKFFDGFKYYHASTLEFEFPVLGHQGEKLCHCPCG